MKLRWLLAAVPFGLLCWLACVGAGLAFLPTILDDLCSGLASRLWAWANGWDEGPMYNEHDSVGEGH
jgi:hypothetical protein